LDKRGRFQRSQVKAVIDLSSQGKTKTAAAKEYKKAPVSKKRQSENTSETNICRTICSDYFGCGRRSYHPLSDIAQTAGSACRNTPLCLAPPI